VFLPSVPLGCSCSSTVDETLQKAARGLTGRMKKAKSNWAAGRVGDIDFVGFTKTRGKVKPPRWEEKKPGKRSHDEYFLLDR